MQSEFDNMGFWDSQRILGSIELPAIDRCGYWVISISLIVGPNT